jgi:hypothetical protein
MLCPDRDGRAPLPPAARPPAPAGTQARRGHADKYLDDLRRGAGQERRPGLSVPTDE